MRRLGFAAVVVLIGIIGAFVGYAVADSDARPPALAIEYLEIDNWYSQATEIQFVAIRDTSNGATCYGFVGAVHEVQCLK